LLNFSKVVNSLSEVL